VGYPKEANAVILVKRLNRRKFRLGATSFLAMGSSLYITGVEVFAFAETMLLRGDSIQRFRFG
jgi:hypothetical protein